MQILWCVSGAMASFDPLGTCCLLEHFLSPLAAHSESLTQPFRVVVLAVWPAYATRTRTNNEINKVATRLFIISSIFFNVNRFDMSGGLRGVAPRLQQERANWSQEIQSAHGSEPSGY